MTSKPDVRERAALLMLALVCLLALVWIAIEGINHRVPNDSQTLIGVVVTGLLAFQKDILQAIRAFWQEERVGKITDQLAASGPSGGPLDVTVTNAPTDPVPTTPVEDPAP